MATQILASSCPEIDVFNQYLQNRITVSHINHQLTKEVAALGFKYGQELAKYEIDRRDYSIARKYRKSGIDLEYKLQIAVGLK